MRACEPRSFIAIGLSSTSLFTWSVRFPFVFPLTSSSGVLVCSLVLYWNSLHSQDIIDSTMGNLGWFDAESYGLTWKVRGFCKDLSNQEIFEDHNVYGDIQGSEIYGARVRWYDLISFAKISRQHKRNTAGTRPSGCLQKLSCAPCVKETSVFLPAVGLVVARRHRPSYVFVRCSFIYIADKCSRFWSTTARQPSADFVLLPDISSFHYLR